MELDFTPQIIAEKEKKTLNKPFRTPNGPKKFSVYVKNEKGNIVKVNFGDPKMEIKRDDPERRKNFRARHNCDNPGPKTKARYWSCKFWESNKSVTDYLKSSENDWDGQTFADIDELIDTYPALAFVEEEVTEEIEADCGCEHEEQMEVEKGVDHEPKMLAVQLMKISKQAGALAEMMKSIDPHTDIDSWVQDKISVATHHIEAAHDYMMYSEIQEPQKMMDMSGGMYKKYGMRNYKKNYGYYMKEAGYYMKEAKHYAGCGMKAGSDMSKYVFNNPGEAMKKAKEMGLDKIHTHETDDDKSIFMPGKTHEELMKKIKEMSARHYGEDSKKKKKKKK